MRAAAFLLVAVAFPAAAEDLLQVYRDAQRYDAVYTGARYSLVEFAARELIRSLEEHMLDPMADARRAGQFVAAADPIEDPETGHRRDVALLEQHAQPIIKLDGLQSINGHSGSMPLARQRGR